MTELKMEEYKNNLKHNEQAIHLRITRIAKPLNHQTSQTTNPLPPYAFLAILTILHSSKNQKGKYEILDSSPLPNSVFK